MRQRASFGAWILCVMFGAALAVVPADVGSASSLPRWSLTIQGAPATVARPQDLWIAGMGNNTDGWTGGGSICLGRLAQGIPEGDHALLQTRVVEGGIFGVDGTPVPAGDYFAPGFEDPPGDRNFTLTVGTSFYTIVETLVIESTLTGPPFFLIPGDRGFLMLTWEHEGAGRRIANLTAWSADTIDGFTVPFLNEGPMMVNVRQLR